MTHSLWWMLKLNINLRGAPTCYQMCAAHVVWKPWFFGWHLYQEATLSSQYISVILEVQHIMFSTRIWLGWLPTGQKTSCWAVWIQEFSQPVQWQIQYLDLARSHSVEGFKTTSLCKGSSKIWSFVASESMSFAAPFRFSIIKLLFSASDSSVVSPEAERTRNSRSNSLLQRPGVTNFRGRVCTSSWDQAFD